ncbi:Uncharacterised protein [Vibrio cholerae]|nr:Uncharacterised protein [Vibrio cholerae]
MNAVQGGFVHHGQRAFAAFAPIPLANFVAVTAGEE